MADYTIYNPPLDDADYPAKFDLFFPALTSDVNAVEVLSAANALYIDGISTNGFSFDNAVSLVFGTDSDTSISHTGANTDISHAALAAGDLRLIHDTNIVSIGATYVNLLDNVQLQFGTASNSAIRYFPSTSALFISSQADIELSASVDINIQSTNIHLTGATVITGTLDITDTQFLRSDVSDTKSAGSLTFNDNIALLVGTDGDLEIINDGGGVSSLIATDFLYIESVGFRVVLAHTTDTGLIQSYNVGLNPSTCISFGGTDDNVSLYYNNVARLTTTNTGVNITGSVNGLNTKIIEIGPWNMDITFTVQIIHGLTLAKIRSISAVIRDDTESQLFDFSTGYNAGASTNGYLQCIGTTVNLQREINSTFDSVSFSSTLINRGWITITYID